MEEKRKPVRSCALSLAVPGLGQLYSGSPVLSGLFFSLLVLWYAAGAVLNIPYTYTGLYLFIAGIVCIHIVSAAAGFIYTAIRKPAGVRRYNRWYLYLPVILLYAVCTYASIPEIFGLKNYFISGGSMSPALEQGDYVMATKEKEMSHIPARGEIIMFHDVKDSSRIIISRCIALPGDTVSLSDGQLVLNGTFIVEDYAQGRTSLQGFNADRISGIVPPDMMIVLGDNRENSADSRLFGPVPIRNVAGKVLYVYLGGSLKKKNRAL